MKLKQAKQAKPNDMMLQVTMRLLTLIFFAFAFYLFFAGHNAPGGGFIGGLMTASAILILYLAFNMKVIMRAIRVNFTVFIGLGLLVAAFTGVASMILGDPFLTHYFGLVNFPLFGEVELASALSFDLGVYLVVIGAAMTIILSIAEDDE